MFYKIKNVYAKGVVTCEIHPINEQPCIYFSHLLDYTREQFKNSADAFVGRKIIILQSKNKNNKQLKTDLLKGFKNTCIIPKHQTIYY